MPTTYWHEDYLEYIIEEVNGEDTITIYGYIEGENPDHPEVEIPSHIEHNGQDLPVKRVGVEIPTIDEEAGEITGAPFPRTGITKVKHNGKDNELPETVEHIGPGAFMNNPYIGSADNEINTIIFPDNLKTIEGMLHEGTITIVIGAFRECGLTGDLNLPDSLEEIGLGAFRYDDISGTLTIPNNVAVLEDEAFSHNNLTKVIIGNNITEIGINTFRANDLTEVIIGDSVEIIGEDSFRGNDIIEVTIPNSVETIGNNAFMHNNLEGKITIPNNVKNINHSAFR